MGSAYGREIAPNETVTLSSEIFEAGRGSECERGATAADRELSHGTET